VFKKCNDRLETLAPYFWHDHIKCYEVHMVMRQNDMEFIHTLNKFRIASHTKSILIN
jgi:hypothetical protein